MNIEPSIKLRSCPFCGGEGEAKCYSWETDWERDDYRIKAFVKCKDCGARGKTIRIFDDEMANMETADFLKRLAVKAWNNRIGEENETDLVLKKCT